MKLQKIIRKSLVESADFENSDDYIDELSEGKESDVNPETVVQYTSYVTEIMSVIVFYADPTINLEVMLPRIKEAARIAVQMTRFLYKVIHCNGLR